MMLLFNFSLDDDAMNYLMYLKIETPLPLYLRERGKFIVTRPFTFCEKE